MGSVDRGQRMTWAGKLLETAGHLCRVGCDPAGEGRGLGGQVEPPKIKSDTVSPSISHEEEEATRLGDWEIPIDSVNRGFRGGQKLMDECQTRK